MPQRTLRSWTGDGFVHVFHTVDADGVDFDLTGATIGFRILSMVGGSTILSLVSADAELTITAAEGLIAIAIPYNHATWEGIKPSQSYAFELDVTLPAGEKDTWAAGPFLKYKEGESITSSDTAETEITVNEDGEVTQIQLTGSILQPYDAGLASIAGLATSADQMLYLTGEDVYTTTSLTSFARTLLDDANAGAARTTLGVVIGTDVQAYDAELAALAGLTSAADKLPYFTGLGTASVADFTAFGRTLVDDADNTAARTTLGLGSLATLSSVNNANWSGADLEIANGGTGSSTASAARTALGVEIGTNVQAWDADLDAIAALTKTDGNFIVGDGAAWVAESGNIARTSLGLGAGDSPTFTGLTLTGDLEVQGNTTTFDTSTLTVEDPLVAFASNNAGDAVDIGFYGAYSDDAGVTTEYAGLFRDATDEKWRLFHNLTEAPAASVNIAGAGYAVPTLVANIEAATATITGGSITGITDLAVADGGTGASSASAARSNLGFVNTTTDNAVTRFDGTTGQTQNSGVIISDTDNVTGIGALSITSMGQNWTNAGRTVADLGIVTTIDINGGTIDGTIIGGAVPAAITGTTATIGTILQGTTANGYLALRGDSAATVNLRYTDAGLLLLGDTTNANMTVGLTLNQGAANDQIMAFKSSGVAHGMTSVIEADTYGDFAKSDPGGGLRIRGHIMTGYAGFGLYFIGSTDDAATTTKLTTSHGQIVLSARIKSGTTYGAVGADGNLVTINNDGTTRFIFDAEGSAHGDVEFVAFDKHDDLLAMEQLEVITTGRKSTLTPERYGGNALAYGKEWYEDNGIVGRDSWHEENGKQRQMVNFTRLSMLHHGAILQLADRHIDVAEAIQELVSLNPSLVLGDKSRRLLA